MFEYLFGPRFSAPVRRATVFGHVLAGGVYHWQDTAGFGPATEKGSGFAMAYGGGVDVEASERIAFRVVQFDWIPIRDNGSWKKDTTRFGFGVVFRSPK